MAPAQQSLEADHGAGAQIHLGLVKHRHLIAFEGLIQIDGHGHADVGALAQLRDRRSPQRLRPSRRALNMATRASRRSSAAMVCGLVQRAIPAQALMDNLRILQREGPRERRQEGLGERLCLLGRRGVQQESELVGAHARQQRRGMDRGFRNRRGGSGPRLRSTPDLPPWWPKLSFKFWKPSRSSSNTVRDFPGRCRRERCPPDGSETWCGCRGR